MGLASASMRKLTLGWDTEEQNQDAEGGKSSVEHVDDLDKKSVERVD